MKYIICFKFFNIRLRIFNRSIINFYSNCRNVFRKLKDFVKKFVKVLSMFMMILKVIEMKFMINCVIFDRIYNVVDIIL